MAEIKKDQEELFRRIYKIATDLVHAGHVAEWDFKSYVLGTMFYRYISENFTAYINEGEHAAGNQDFDYAKMSDADAETARETFAKYKKCTDVYRARYAEGRSVERLTVAG